MSGSNMGKHTHHGAPIRLVTVLALLFLVAGCSGHGTNEPMPGPDSIPEKTVISEETTTVPSGENYALQLKQTEYMKLLAPSDPEFDICEGAYRGRRPH